MSTTFNFTKTGCYFFSLFIVGIWGRNFNSPKYYYYFYYKITLTTLANHSGNQRDTNTENKSSSCLVSWMPSDTYTATIDGELFTLRYLCCHHRWKIVYTAIPSLPPPMENCLHCDTVTATNDGEMFTLRCLCCHHRWRNVYTAIPLLPPSMEKCLHCDTFVATTDGEMFTLRYLYCHHPRRISVDVGN